MAVFKGNGLVWSQGKVIARFIEGQYQTDDVQMMQTLNSMGYQIIAGEIPLSDFDTDIESFENGSSPEETKQDWNSMTVPGLKAACESRGLKGYAQLNKKDLINLLEGDTNERTVNSAQ